MLWYIRWCRWKIWMVASLLKQEIFVRGEMVMHLIFLASKVRWLLGKTLKCLSLYFVAGRGVDLNRNWSVDWGKKEKVHDLYHFLYYVKYAVYISKACWCWCINLVNMLRWTLFKLIDRALFTPLGEALGLIV